MMQTTISIVRLCVLMCVYFVGKSYVVSLAAVICIICIWNVGKFGVLLLL